MDSLVAVVPNNQQLEADTTDPIVGYVALRPEDYGTASLYITACGTYAKQVGQRTEVYFISTPEGVSYPVGRPSLWKDLGNDIIVFEVACGVRLEIRAVGTGTYATRESLSQLMPGFRFSKDTTVPQMPSFDPLEAFSRLNVASLLVQVPERGYEKFIERIHKPRYRSEAMIKGKGIPAWAIAAYVLDLGLSFEEVVSDWGGEISVDEVKAAMEYYQAYPGEVEQKRQWNPRR